jgi:hypothetical protein
MSKLSIIPNSSSWEEKKTAWEKNVQYHQKNHPLKQLKSLPNMVGVTKETARFLRIKALWYLLSHDTKNIFLRYFFKRPILYGISLFTSYLHRKSFLRQDDFFFYGLKTEEEFTKLICDEKTILIVGFSYCHKPLECPSGRFSDRCDSIADHPVCSQCFIGKCNYLLSSTKAKIVYIPTIHYIGEKIFEATHQYPGYKIAFLITACEMSLRMFGDWGNMVGAKGIGVRLDGRICNTMRAFILSEEGVKPGLTVVLDPTQEKILSLLKHIHKDVCDEKA